MEGGSVCEADQVQSPIDVDQTTITGPTRGAASELGGKRRKSNGMDIAVDEARRRSAMWCMGGR